jgi:altronate dehydratase
MDIDAGTIVDGLETHDAVGERVFQTMLDVASGRRTASELLGYGEEEFAPWTPGLTY